MKGPVIDCDVHAVVPRVEALLPYLPAYWREQIAQTGFKGPVDRWRPWDPVAAPPLAEIRERVLDASPPASLAILTCDYAVESLHNPDAAAALATAVNDWLAEHWLAAEPRLRASIVVPSQFPDLAAAEIERRAGQPGFVQVLLPVHSASPYGSRGFRPLFAAAAAHGLPVALHYGGAPGNPPTPAGWTSYWMEDYAGATGLFATQLLSVIAGGLLADFPSLRLVLAEGGFTWLPAMLWRLDKNWKGLQRETPWVRRPPSEYVRDHVRLTTAPADAPADPGVFAELVAELGDGALLLHASDYPHDHHEEFAAAGWAALPAETRDRIASANARAWYRL